MEGIVVIDTCVLFDFMAGRDKNKNVETMLLNSQAVVSVMTVYELFRGVENEAHIQQRRELVDLCQVLDITEPISWKASKIYTELKKKGALIANQDIFIAATAIHWKYPLLTANKKDFQKIPGVHLA